MKSLIAIALIAAAAPALAQTTPAPAPAPAPAAAPAAASKFNLDTPIVDLVANADAKAVLDKDLGMDVSKHPSYDAFKSMSLSAVAPYSNGMMTDEVLKKLATDLAAVK